MKEYEHSEAWQDINERISQNEKMQEKVSDLETYLDNEWQSLIIERARIETEIEKCG